MQARRRCVILWRPVREYPAHAQPARPALGIESDDVVGYCFPTEWPADRERRARYIGEWLKTEARFLAS